MDFNIINDTTATAYLQLGLGTYVDVNYGTIDFTGTLGSGGSAVVIATIAPGATATDVNITEAIAAKLLLSLGTTLASDAPSFTSTDTTVPNYNTRWDKVELSLYPASDTTHSSILNLTAADFFGLDLQVQTFASATTTVPAQTLGWDVGAQQAMQSLAALSNYSPYAVFTGPDGVPVTTSSGTIEDVVRVVAPSSIAAAAPANPYPSFEAYIQSIQNSGVVTTVADMFDGNPMPGTITPVGGTLAFQAQAFSFEATINPASGTIPAGTSPGDLVLVGTAALIPGTETIDIPGGTGEAALSAGIYSANPPFTVNGTADTVGNNDVYSKAVAEILAGFDSGFVGSSETDPNTGTSYAASPTDTWYYNPTMYPGYTPYTYAYAAAQPSHPNYYDDYAATVAQDSDGSVYGSPFSDLLGSPQASITPATINHVNITILPDSIPTPSTVSVPGAPPTTNIPYTNVFNTPFNLPLAQNIANALDGALTGDTLNSQTYTPPTTPAAIAGDTNELVVPTSSSGGTVFVPAGYAYAADSTGGANFTIVGAQNFIGGSGDITVWDTVGASSVGGGIDTITAGDGNDLFGLIPASTYDVAGGNGADTYVGLGSGTLAGGTGDNQFWVDGGSNLVLSYGTDTIVAAGGASTIATYGNGQLIFGGSGNMDVFGTGATNLTVGGSTAGPATIFSAQSGVYFLGSSTTLFIGTPSSSSTIVGSTAISGAETVFGGASGQELIFNNSSSLLFVSGSDDSTTIVGGSSPSSLFGSAGSSITYFSTSSVGGALFAAGTGNETLNAAGSTANTIFGGSDSTAGNSLVGGAGDDTYVVGTGSDTLVGGAGANVFVFDNGHAGGNDFIAGYNASDVVGLFGYGSSATTAALAAATVAGGNTTIALSDNTKITFEGISTPSPIHIFST